MEPEKIISEKILLEEQRPLRWQKDRVWRNIPREKKHRQYGMISIAASVALATLLVLFFIQRYFEQALQERISLLDWKVRGFETEITDRSKTAQPSLKKENCESIAMTKRIERNAIAKRQTEGLSLNDTVTVTLDIPEEIPGADTTVVANLVADRSEDLPKIEAVIGFIPVQRQPLHSAKVKKSEKLHFGFSRDQKDFFQQNVRSKRSPQESIKI